jgi:PhzF family phenazine biosynthesis protein
MNFAPGKAITEPQIFQVKSFVAAGCRGNPAGVCLLPSQRDDNYYRKVAVKIAATETAFVYQSDDIYQLRWFTRAGSEVDLCGHATLAAASILWDRGYVDPGKIIRFSTRSGILSAKREGDYVTLDFPREKITEIKSGRYDFGEILGLSPLYTGQTSFDYLVIADSEESVKNLMPDFDKIRKIKTRGVIVSAKSSHPEYDFVSRFFAPLVGIDEDPVTGSAHCALGVYWSRVLNKNSLVAYQASREGGVVRVTVLKDRILLGGKTREVPVAGELKKSILSE